MGYIYLCEAQLWLLFHLISAVIIQANISCSEGDKPVGFEHRTSDFSSQMLYLLLPRQRNLNKTIEYFRLDVKLVQVCIFILRL